MSDSFGLKIGLEGEKEFKKALGEINQSFKVLGPEMKVVSSQFDKNDRSVDALTARNQVLNKEIKDAGNQSEDAGGKFEKLGGICKAAGVAIGAAFAAVSAAAIAAGKALIDMTVNGAAYADAVLTESTVTGIATDKLQEYMYAAELVDVSTDTLTKSMAKRIKSMKGVQDGTKLSVEAYLARYEGLTSRYETISMRVNELEALKAQRQNTADSIGAFMFAIHELEGQALSFSSRLWLTTIDKAIVHSDGRITFQFISGAEIDT